MVLEQELHLMPRLEKKQNMNTFMKNNSKSQNSAYDRILFPKYEILLQNK